MKGFEQKKRKLSEASLENSEDEQEFLQILDPSSRKKQAIFYENIGSVYVFGPVIGKGRYGDVRVA